MFFSLSHLSPLYFYRSEESPTPRDYTQTPCYTIQKRLVSIVSPSPLPSLSLCILSSPLQRLTSYFLTSRNRATPHVFPNHFLNRKMTFSSSIYDRVPLQLVIFERLQSARHSSLYILIYRACIIGDTIKINPSNTTLIYIHPFIDSEYRNERKN